MMRRAVALLVVAAACRGHDVPKPNGNYPPEYAEQIDSAVLQVERATGLKFRKAPKVEMRSKAQVRQFLEQQFADSDALRELAGAEATYKLLGEIPDTMQLRPLFEDLLAEQIVGYYDPHTKVLYLPEGANPTITHITIDHELVHALQDQYTNVDSLLHVSNDGDRASAAQAVLEGQATFEQMKSMFGNSNLAMRMPEGWDRVRDQIRANSASMPRFAAAPMVIQETLIFPYLSGAEFTRLYEGHYPGRNMLTDLPTSTEQVIHEAAFFGKRDEPTRVVLPSIAGYQNTLGEFETRLFLFAHLGDQSSAIRGAAGWDGDRFVIHDNGITWVLVWDTPVDAADFLDLAARAERARYGVTDSSGTAGDTRVIHAKGRAVTVAAVTIAGRPAVVLSDLPAGAPAAFDVAKVTLAGN